MENAPDKWEHQTWSVPFPMWLTRHGDKYYIECYQGMFALPVDRRQGVKLADVIYNFQQWRQRKYRRSLPFKWLRFWYLRKHKYPHRQ